MTKLAIMKITDRFRNLSRRKKIVFGVVMLAWLFIRVAFIVVPVVRSCIN